MTTPRLFAENIPNLHSYDVQNLFKAYAPDFWQNIQLGYIRDSEVFTMGSKVLALADTDGLVNAKYKGTVAPNTGPIPREYDFYGNIGLPATDTVRAESTSSEDTSYIRIRGVRSDGIETEEVLKMNGTTFTESQTLWLTVHWVEYLPYLRPDNEGGKQYYNEGEITCSDPELDVYPSMVMEPKTCRASNSIYRCPKYMKAFIVDQWFDVESGCSQGIFIQDENRYVAPEDSYFAWHQLYEGPVNNGGVSNQVKARRSIDDGDYWALMVRNPSDSLINCYWQQRIVQCVIDYAPEDYKLNRVWPVGVTGWGDLIP